MFSYTKLFVYLTFAMYLIGCGSSKNTTKTTESKSSIGLAVGGNFSDPTGLVYSFNLSDTLTLDKVSFNGSYINTYQDSIVRSYNENYFIFGRDSSSAVIVLNSLKLEDGPIANYSLTETDPSGSIDVDGGFNGTNPYEIAFKDESSAFVALYNSNFVLNINPLTGQRLDKIDVSIAKTIPNATPSDANTPGTVDLELIDNKLFILFQRLNSSFVALESVILIYDIENKAFIDTNTLTSEIDGIILSGKNPSMMQYDSESKNLYIAHKGNITYSPDFLTIIETESGTAGIEEVSTESLTSNGMILTGQNFSGTTEGFGVSQIIKDKSGLIYAVFETFSFTSNIKSIDLTLKTVSENSILPENSPAFGDITFGKDGYLYLIYRDSTTPSIKQINKETGETIKTFSTELPMQSIIHIE